MEQITHGCDLTLFCKLSFQHQIVFFCQASFGHLFLIPRVWLQNPYTLAACIKGEIWSHWVQDSFSILVCLTVFKPCCPTRLPWASLCSIAKNIGNHWTFSNCLTPSLKTSLYEKCLTKAECLPCPRRSLHHRWIYTSHYGRRGMLFWQEMFSASNFYESEINKSPRVFSSFI